MNFVIFAFYRSCMTSASYQTTKACFNVWCQWTCSFVLSTPWNFKNSLKSVNIVYNMKMDDTESALNGLLK